MNLKCALYSTDIKTPALKSPLRKHSIFMIINLKKYNKNQILYESFSPHKIHLKQKTTFYTLNEILFCDKFITQNRVSHKIKYNSYINFCSCI